MTLVDEETREGDSFILQGGPQPLGKLDVAYKSNLQNEASRKNQSKGTVKPRKNVYEKYLDTHADVWSFYLKETEAEDKELVEFWKDGLDSLLIFVSKQPFLFFHYKALSIVGRSIRSSPDRFSDREQEGFGG